MGSLATSTASDEAHTADSVLVVCGFTTKPHKFDTHVKPLSEAGADVTVVWFNSSPYRTDVPTSHLQPTRFRPLGFVRLCLVTIALAWRGDYDLIASFSLLPYGVIALVAGALSRTSTHLGIMGSDLDVHESNPYYGRVIRWLFRRFSVITVGASEFRDRVIRCDVDPARIHLVTHPVDIDDRCSDRPTTKRYDLLWLAGLIEAKDPMLFVDIVERLADRHPDLTAAMVGDGQMFETVRTEIVTRGLEDTIDLPGWTDAPIDYYRQARVFVLTSRREMLPLTLVESMLTGVPTVAPRLGGIPDLVTNGDNGLLVDDRTVEAYIDAIDTLLSDRQYREELGMRAREIEPAVSFDAVADTWRDILEVTQPANPSGHPDPVDASTTTDVT